MAKEFNHGGGGTADAAYLFAATSPLEGLRFLVSEVATTEIGLEGGGEGRENKEAETTCQ